MAENADFYKNLVDDMYDGVYFVDKERRITYWNHGAERITGYKSKQVMDRSCSDNLLNHITVEGKLLCLEACPLADCMLSGKPVEAEVYLHHAKGHRVPVHVRAAPMKDEKGEIIGAVETFSKPAGGKLFEAELTELRHKANTDKITGLRNRSFIDANLKGLLVASQGGEVKSGVMFIDIDFFKEINDEFGHEVGDKALVMTAQTLQNNLRGSDIIGRWGGDEFLVIAYDFDSAKSLEKLAEKLRTLVAFSTLDIGKKNISVTVSIGATLIKNDDTIETLVNRADALMYEIKRSGRNKVAVG